MTVEPGGATTEAPARRGLAPVLVAVTLLLVVTLAVLAIAFGRPGETRDFEPVPAPALQTDDIDGTPFDLASLRGNVTVLHFTAIEEPVCLECEGQMRAQTEALATLLDRPDPPRVVTVNMRSSELSSDGRDLAESWWGLAVNWTWIEELPPFQAAAAFRDYWTYRGGTSNPTVVLLDEELRIVAVRHVYQMGKGEVDGVQTADKLAHDVALIRADEWEGAGGTVSAGETTVATMFALGVLTSVTPCSIALLAVVISYIMSRRSLEGGKGAVGTRGASTEGLAIGAAFTLGMALVFLAIGCLLGQLGGFISASPAFYIVAGALLVVLGVNSLWPLGSLLPRRASSRPDGESNGSGGILQRMLARFPQTGTAGAVAGGLAIGVLFGLAWTPCAISLILPVLVVVMAKGYSWLVAGALMFVFGLGHGVPIIPLAVATRAARGGLATRYATLGRWVVRAFGVVIIALGFIFVLRYFGVALW